MTEPSSAPVEGGEHAAVPESEDAPTALGGDVSMGIEAASPRPFTMLPASAAPATSCSHGGSALAEPAALEKPAALQSLRAVREVHGE